MRPRFHHAAPLSHSEAEKTVGVDRSEAFVNRALASAAVLEEYVVADVAAPMRIEGLRERPDLIYARFLASHLPEPERAISCWAKELEAGGLLLVEEVESISTLVAAFEQYLKIVSEMLDHYGNELFVGSRLATARWDDGLRVEVNRTAEVRPSTGQAARMFSTNLPNWRHDPYVEANHPPDKLERLAAELDQLTGSAEKGRIAWRMSQIALGRLRRRNHYL